MAAAHARFLVAAGAQEKWADIEAATGALRRALILRQLTRHPWRTMKSLLLDADRLAGAFLRPPGVTVVLCGADGSGKSTAAAAVVEGLQRHLQSAKVHHFHWKPPLFSAGRRAARGPATDPHGKPRSQSGRFTLLLRVSLAGVLSRLAPAISADDLPGRAGAD